MDLGSQPRLDGQGSPSEQPWGPGGPGILAVCMSPKQGRCLHFCFHPCITSEDMWDETLTNQSFNSLALNSYQMETSAPLLHEAGCHPYNYCAIW